MNVFKNIFLVIVNPKLGWDEINASAHTTQKVQQSGFYPMLAILAIVSFVPMLYDVDNTLTVSLIHAISEFVSYFATFFISSYLLGALYPQLVKSNSSTTRTNNFIIYNIIYLVVLEILNNILDNGFPPVYFLLLYTPIIAFKGLEYIGFNDEKQIPKFVIIASLFFVLTPIIIRFLLEKLIIR